MVKPSGSGTGEDEEEESQWEYFHLLQFLNDFVKHRNTTSNVPTPIPTDQLTPSCSNESQSVEEPHDGPPVSPLRSPSSNTTDDTTPLSSNQPMSSDSPNLPITNRYYNIMHCVLYYQQGYLYKQYSLYNMLYIICRSILKRKRRTVAMDPLEREIVNTLSEFSKSASGMFSPQQPTNTLDEEDHFAGSVAATLRRLQPRSRAIAKFRIQEILLQLEFPQPEPSVPAPTPSTYYPNNPF